jgi:hypothetical protein
VILAWRPNDTASQALAERRVRRQAILADPLKRVPIKLLVKRVCVAVDYRLLDASSYGECFYVGDWLPFVDGSNRGNGQVGIPDS